MRSCRGGKESFSDVILRLIEGSRMRSLELLERYSGRFADGA
ncbi:MAG: hypothetical protein KIH04_03395 [Candidatus Freyarchaeota archaeon]|nr:hypothetical protein [Candidatus Jordarchaeia archaeon]